MSFSKTNLEFGLDYQVFIIQYKDNAVVPNVKYPKESAQFLKEKKNNNTVIGNRQLFMDTFFNSVVMIENQTKEPPQRFNQL